jgi:hydroxypyruvate isomerase
VQHPVEQAAGVPEAAELGVAAEEEVGEEEVRENLGALTTAGRALAHEAVAVHLGALSAAARERAHDAARVDLGALAAAGHDGVGVGVGVLAATSVCLPSVCLPSSLAEYFT